MKIAELAQFIRHRGARMMRLRGLQRLAAWFSAAMLSACAWVDRDADGPYRVAEGGVLKVEADDGLLAGRTGEARLIAGPEHAASFELESDGSFYYVHGGGEAAQDTFVYRVEQDAEAGLPETVRIAIAPRNDAPVTADVALVVPKGGTAVGKVLASDPDHRHLRFVASRPTWGTLRLDQANGEFVYSPVAGYVGEDSFVVSVIDPQGAAAAARVAIQVMGAPGPLPGGGGNRPPTIDDVALETVVGSAVTVVLAAGDPDGDDLTFTVTPPEGGLASVDDANGVLTYMPSPKSSGVDSFQITVHDGRGGSDTAMVSVSVHNPNPPVARGAEPPAQQ